MPSVVHSGLLQPFEHRPALVADLLTKTFGLKLPAWGQARLTSADVTEVVSTEYRADLALALYDAERPVLAVVLEVQLREDKDKLYSWPVYLATLRAKLRCPAVLLVVSPRRATAAWAANAIEIGPCSEVTPLVLGPAQTPVLTDPAQALTQPELAVLSAMAHGRRHPDRNRVLDAFRTAVRALESVDKERAEVYLDVVRAALPAGARRYLEGLMKTEYRFQSDIAIRQMAEGRTEDVLIVLDARGIDVPAKARERITRCTDSKKITTWLRRAATATSVRDLFAK